MQQGLQCRHQCIGDDRRTFLGGVDSVTLDGSWNVDEIFVDHGDEGGVVFGSKCFEDLVELQDVIRPIVWGQSDSGQQHFDVRGFERGNDLIKVAARLLKGKSSQSVIASEFNDDDIGMKVEDRLEAGERVLGSGSAGAFVFNFVTIALGGK